MSQKEIKSPAGPPPSSSRWYRHVAHTHTHTPRYMHTWTHATVDAFRSFRPAMGTKARTHGNGCPLFPVLLPPSFSAHTLPPCPPPAPLRAGVNVEARAHVPEGFQVSLRDRLQATEGGGGGRGAPGRRGVKRVLRRLPPALLAFPAERGLSPASPGPRQTRRGSPALPHRGVSAANYIPH